MGDMVELITWPNDHNLFYKITSSGLMFEVKGTEGACIGLSTEIGDTCDFWVGIGCSQSTFIKNPSGLGKSTRTPNIINNEEYRKFWLTWRNNCIQIGRDNSRKPIVSYNHKTELNYITFGSSHDVVGEIGPIHYRFELSPVMEKPKLNPVSCGKLHWVQAGHHLPDGALIGGYESEPLYVIRAPHRGSLTPGKFVPSAGLGYVSWGGDANEKTSFEVLCGFDCIWVKSTDDIIPVGAVEAGYSEDHIREKLYVGRAFHEGHLIPGKVQPSHKVCYIAYDEREVAAKSYEILVAPYQNANCANTTLMEHIDVGGSPEIERVRAVFNGVYGNLVDNVAF
ncbi:hypothetical protein ACJJTC_010231 [Scirpophaga incertulas]